MSASLRRRGCSPVSPSLARSRYASRGSPRRSTSAAPRFPLESGAIALLAVGIVLVLARSGDRFGGGELCARHGPEPISFTWLHAFVGAFPRMLSVVTSSDGDSWQTSFKGRLGGHAVMAFGTRPRGAMLEFPLPNAPALFIRLQIEAHHPKIAWVVTDVTVIASPPE